MDSVCDVAIFAMTVVVRNAIPNFTYPACFRLQMFNSYFKHHFPVSRSVSKSLININQHKFFI